ncbi:hypothetical protein Pfo_026732 [Paulownia fortunei]|nr:hypothetical protein Pfo_026732 [Paulownia fortunei]
MRTTIAENIRLMIPKIDSAKEFMKFVEDHSQSNFTDKSVVGTLMGMLTTMKFDGSRTMHEHITEMTNIAARLGSMGLKVSDNFLVQFIIDSLPPEYSPFQINYNTIKDKWNVSELQSMLIQEEARLKKQCIHSINLVNQSGAKKNPITKNGKGNKGPLKINGSSAQIHKKERKNDACRFCRKPGHYQKDCLKRKAWFEKKGKSSAFVCFKSNLAEVLYNTWWIDSGCTTHVLNTMQGFLMTQTINLNENFVFMGNRVKALVEAIGTYCLILDTGHYLDLFQTLYVPSVSHNLVYLSKLNTVGYSFKFWK